MLQSVTSKIEHKTLEALSRGPQTAHDIFVYLKKGHIDCTIQGIYRILRKLSAAGVVTKQKKRYLISLSWLLDAQSMVSNMEKSYMKTSDIGQLLPIGMRKKTWKFTNLLHMNTFWSHLLLSVTKETDSSYSLHYYPHAWHHILHEDHSIQFTKAMSQLTQASYTVHGYRTYLNQMVSRVLADEFKGKQSYVATLVERISPQEHIYIDIIGDYVITLELDQITHERIRDIFVQTKIGEDIDALLLAAVFAHTPELKLSIKKSPGRAKSIRRKFSELFGPLDKK